MLASSEIAERLVESAGITKLDTVLEIGAGTGVVTGRLCNAAGKVISYEIDRRLFDLARSSLGEIPNLELRLGDAFISSDNVKFDICVTSLPYSESLRFVRWLSLKSGTFVRSVAILQSEFAGKLCSEVGKDSYRAVSVIAQLSFRIERLFQIEKNEFDPPPRVQSEAVRLTPKGNTPFFNPQRIALLNKLFSFKGRLLSAAIRKLELHANIARELLSTRVEDLSPAEFAEIILASEV